MGIIDKIKEWLGIASEVNLCTPRQCLSAFTRAIDKCDMNADGMINSKELLKLYKDMSINSVIGYEMTTSELETWLKNFCKDR
jgi:Ca2+-binding EF-hand superfamily protein